MNIVSQECDISDEQVICNGVRYEGNPSDCQGKNQGVLCGLARHVRHLKTNLKTISYNCWSNTFVETIEEVTFPAVSTLSVTMSSVLEELPVVELVIFMVSDVPAGLLVAESNVVEERELPNALLVEVVEVQLDAGSVMVSRV